MLYHKIYMNMYVDKKYYQNTYKGDVIPEDKFEEKIKEASMHIDTLTYNRIVRKKFDNLTEFQQSIIREVVCKLADFEYENADILKTPLSSYAINGIPKDYYCLLAQTGLTCRNVRY